MHVVSTSETSDDVLTRLKTDFSLDDLQAAAVMDTQFRQSSITAIRKLREHKCELELELRNLQA